MSLSNILKITEGQTFIIKNKAEHRGDVIYIYYDYAYLNLENRKTIEEGFSYTFKSYQAGKTHIIFINENDEIKLYKIIIEPIQNEPELKFVTVR